MRISLILKSVATTWVAVFVAATTAFFLTPFILHRLGDEAYGLWVLIVALTDYYLFLRVGIRSAIVRYVSRNLALHDEEAVNRTVATSFYFYLCILLLVVSGTLTLAPHVTSFFSVKAENVHSFTALFLLAGIAQGLDFPLNVFEGSLEAVGRFDQLYSLRIAGMILRVALIIIVLEKGGGLLGVGAATVLSTISLRLVAVPLAFREVNAFSLHPRDIDRKTFREMLGYGITSFSVGIGERLNSSLYPVVIAKFLSAAAVTLFALPTKLLNIPLNGIGTMTEFVNPLSSHLDAHQDKAGLRHTLMLCGESTFLLFAPLATLMLVFGKQMLSLWVGNSYVSSYPLLVLLTIGLGMENAQYFMQSMLFGIGRHKGLVWLRLGEGLCTAGLGITLMPFWGLWGYAFATMVISLAVNFLLIPRNLCKILEMPVRAYWIKGCLKPCAFSLPFAAVALLFAHEFPVKSWTGMSIAILCGVAMYLLTLLSGIFLSKRVQISWSSLGILEVLEKRFFGQQEDLEISANVQLFQELEGKQEGVVVD